MEGRAVLLLKGARSIWAASVLNLPCIWYGQGGERCIWILGWIIRIGKFKEDFWPAPTENMWFVFSSVWKINWHCSQATYLVLSFLLDGERIFIPWGYETYLIIMKTEFCFVFTCQIVSVKSEVKEYRILRDCKEEIEPGLGLREGFHR